MDKIKILLITSGPSFTNSIGFSLKYEILSKHLSGDIITPILEDSDSMVKHIDHFNLHTFRYLRGNSVLRNCYSVLSIVKIALRLNKQKKFNVIISTNPLTTGILVIVLSKLLGAKSVVEVNGNFETSFKFGRGGPRNRRFMESIKERMSKPMISWVLRHSDGVKLVYKDQLEPFNSLHQNLSKISVFPNFVPISRFIDAEKTDGKYILLLGYPWYLKGVDILIKAFKNICDTVKDYSLKIVGWCPEGKEYFENLADGNPRIELCDPVYYEEVIPLMCNCSVYVLASRTDSSPRVLREAMAAKKPIVASNIDGVPDLIINDYNGVLFEKENVEDLSNKLLLLLKNKNKADELSQNGFNYVQKYLSEDIYLEKYKTMLDSVL